MTKLRVVFRNFAKSPKHAATRHTDISKIGIASGMAGAVTLRVMYYKYTLHKCLRPFT